ncbi:MAG: glycosyltransferase family 4 protein [Bacteroidia bacterium]|nr:glycosyltransferase family 4 protein [Bacteroidia bacterium]
MRVLFLYSEVAGYFLACAETLHRQYGVEVHVVRWPVNPEAPFRFRDYEGVVLHERRDYDDAGLLRLAAALQPALVFSAGWLDAGYQRILPRIKAQGIPVLCGLDNHWRGDLRQRIAVLLSPWMLHRRFTHIWAPGLYQYEYARRLGFARERILRGYYSADLAPFNEAYRVSEAEKAAAWPRKLLFVGRFVEVKGILELCRAFLAARGESGWTLLLTGAGPLRGQIPAHPAIEVQDFVQPERLPALAGGAGAFVLPSRFEPWGVALHEFAGAGLPLVASGACGAATAFLREGYNGYSFRTGDEASLTAALRRLMALPDAELRRMGARSYELSRQITPETWAAALMSVIADVSPSHR